MASKKSRVLKLTSLFAGLALVAAIAIVAAQTIGANAAPSFPVFKGGKALFYVPKHSAQTRAALSSLSKSSSVTTIPTWSGSYTDGPGTSPSTAGDGDTHNYTMVGTDPSKPAISKTTVASAIVPVTVKFSNFTFSDSKQVTQTVNSPIFQNNQSVNGDKTQYADAVQRAEFGNFVSTTNPHYHVLLGAPKIYPAITITVPSNRGTVLVTQSGIKFGVADVDWFDNIIFGKIQSLHISARTFPIFLTHNVFLAVAGSPNNCCIIGYHNAGQVGSNLFTYAYATHNSPGILNAASIQDVNGLSHEVSEWMNDPFGLNTTDFWSVAGEPQYGCNNALEVGDPLVGFGFVVNGYHLQDEAFLAWFAHQSPSTAKGGAYTFIGTYTTPATLCTPAP